jgi:site-specific recombinase XerD
MKIKNYLYKLYISNCYAREGISKKVMYQQTPDSLESSIYDSSSLATDYLGVEMFSKEEFKKFDNYLLLNKGLQEVTREGHITSMNVVLKRIGTLNPEHNALQEHILWMHEKGYSHSHITNTSKAIEYYTEYLNNPLKIARTKRPQRIIKDCLTEAEINTIIRTANNIRKKAMIVTLAYSGVRNKEFCNIKVSDLDFGNNCIRINNGKNSKDRIVNISAVCSNVLVEYILTYRKDKDDFLFTTSKRNNQYKTSDLRKFVKVLAKKAGIEKRVYPHLFRHSLATNLLKRGANLITIKEQLGHSFIDSTMHYLKIFSHRVKSEYEYYAPAYA